MASMTLKINNKNYDVEAGAGYWKEITLAFQIACSNKRYLRFFR